jgi:DNA-binding HxlR family transcriptional regulator
MGAEDQLGNATLRLLCDECMLIVLRALSRGPVHASDVESSAPGIAHWTARRRLQRLVERGWASAAPGDGARSGSRQAAPPHALYALNEIGRRLLEVYDAAVACEQRWCPPPAEIGVNGLWAIKLAADGPIRTLVRALADGPLLPGDLRARAAGLGRATLFRRLTTLAEAGMLAHDRRSGHYALTAQARHLAIIPVRAGRFERFAAAGGATPPSDLPGLLHVLAPLSHVPREVSGTCRWYFDSGAVTESEVFLAAASGRVAALSAPPMSACDAASHASAASWCDALLRGEPSLVQTSGDETLVAELVAALSGALTR